MGYVALEQGRIKVLGKYLNIGLLCVLWIQGCDKGVWNDPYPQFDAEENTLYSAFTEQPKHLDPALSYSANEAIFTYQIYEPPLQYHYLIRPYALVPLVAKEMPTIEFQNQAGEIVAPSASDIAYTIYRIRLKEGIFYHPHPAFAKDKQGKYLYHDLNKEQVKNKHNLQDFSSQDTRELTSEDFVFEIKRLADPSLNSPIYSLMGNYIVGFEKFAKSVQDAIEKNKTNPDLRYLPFEGAKVIDKYSYEIKIKGKYAQFIYWLAMPFFAPVPWEAVKFYAQPLLIEKNISLDWYPVGTGPFYLAVNNPNSQMILKRSLNFHGETYPEKGSPSDNARGLLKNAGKPLPFLDKIVFILEKESIPYWNKFVQGYYDQAGVTSSNFDQALKPMGDDLGLSDEMKAKGIKLSTTVSPTIYYWGFNMLDETVGGLIPAKNKLRQAIGIAMDMEEYINIFLNSSGLAAQSPIPPSIFGYESGPKGTNSFIYDIKENNRIERKSLAFAKQLLAEAGYKDGIDPKTGEPLILFYDTPIGNGPESAAQLAWIRKQFEKLGIDLNIRATQYNRFQDKMIHGDFQLFSWGWNADYPDPENFLFLFYSLNGKVKYGGENGSNYSNPEFDKLFEEMKDLPNSPERMNLILTMISMLREQSPWFGGFHSKTYLLRHSWVDSVKVNEMSRNTLKYISINPNLRSTLRRKWNQPVIWPIGIGIFLFILLCLPAAMGYWRKIHQPLKLRPLRN